MVLNNHIATKLCHNGPAKVLTYNKNNTALYAGAKSEAFFWIDKTPWTLRIALGDFDRDSDFFPQSVAPAVQFYNLAGLVSEDLQNELRRFYDAGPEPVLGVAWPDMGIPSRLDREWFQSISLMLGSLPANSKVFVHCYGGHGRTGTFLACLASVSGACPKGTDPVEWLRARYCESAVEDESQIKYIERITGETVFVTPHKSSFSYCGYGGGAASTALLPFQTATGGGPGGETTSEGGKAPTSGATLGFKEIMAWYAGDAFIRTEVAEQIESDAVSSNSWVISAWTAARKACNRLREEPEGKLLVPLEVCSVTFAVFQLFCTSDLSTWTTLDADTRAWWTESRIVWAAAHKRAFPDAPDKWDA